MTLAELAHEQQNSLDRLIIKLDRKISHTGPVFWVTLYGVVLIFAIALGTSLMINNVQDREMARSQKELESTLTLLTRHFDTQLETFEAVTKSVADLLSAKVTTPEEFRSWASTQSFHQLLRDKLSATSDFAGVNLFDAEGIFVNSSERWPVPQLSLSDRAFFKAFRSSQSVSPLLIQLVDSRISKGITIVFARRILGANGSFLGMVTRSVSPDTFESFFSSTVLPEESLALVHRDGTLLARYPSYSANRGRTFAETALLAQASSDGYATLQTTSPIDGLEKLASARALEHYPLYVVATRPVAAVFANRNKETQTFSVAAVLVALVVALMLAIIVRHLREQHRRLNIAVSNMTQGLLLYDSSERLVFCNTRYLDMFGLSADLVKPGCRFEDIAQHRKNVGTLVGDVKEYCDRIRQTVHSGQLTIDQLPDGRWLQIATRPVEGGGWVSTVEDVTEQRRSSERTARLAMYDTLTDLPNRAFFHDKLATEIERSTPTSGAAVFFVDTDEFKSINDSLGHHVGDELLRSIAKSLDSCRKPDEFVARLGGDEFALISPGIASEQAAQEVVERLYRALRRPHQCGPHQLSIDASVGIALAPHHGATCDEILQSADLAMYEAKSSGRRTYRFFDPALEAKARDRRLLETDLRKALEDGTLDVFYQPVVNLESGNIAGCEALARWKHGVRGYVSPAEFIPIAEQSGLIEQLGDYVLLKACREAATWPEHVKVAINVSPAQFKAAGFPLRVVAALQQSGLSPRRLELEITETVLIKDDELALAILRDLRAIGVRIALDDFGTGYSSLSYLQRFPFDKIKIDRSFVRGLAEEGGLSIVRAVVDIASERNMTTTAEGVETEAQKATLRQLSCEEMQGFLFSAARPAKDIRELLARSVSVGFPPKSPDSAIGTRAVDAAVAHAAN